MYQTILSTNNLHYEVQNILLLEDITISIQKKDKIGLVGKNGSGKSTLLKILAKSIKPTTGSLSSTSLPYYLPQIDLDLFQNQMALYEYIQKHFEDWWEVLHILEVDFGMKYVKEDQPLNSLSGGELIKIHLGIAKALKPDLLLLDEPTNHLDIISQEQLLSFLHEFTGAFVLVSHNPFFLDKSIDRIWEIEDHKLKVWGGNYANFKYAKELLLEAKARQFEVARKEIAKVKKSIAKEEIRAARSKRAGRIEKSQKSVDRFATSFFGNKASASAGDNKQKLASILENKVMQMGALKEKKDRNTIVDLNTTRNNKATLLRISNGTIFLPGKKMLIQDISLQVSYGDRLALTGKNGSGKTSFLKGIIGDENVRLEGEIYKAENLKVIYLSQKYDIVDPSKTLIENIVDRNKTLSYELVRKQLGNFLFLDEQDIIKKASYLSGGETARLAYAMITASPIDILILDEPTNNLDLQTVDSIVGALKEFQGSIIAISHDIEFLQKIGIENTYLIKDSRLSNLFINPSDPERFYNVLVHNFNN